MLICISPTDTSIPPCGGLIKPISLASSSSGNWPAILDFLDALGGLPVLCPSWVSPNFNWSTPPLSPDLTSLFSSRVARLSYHLLELSWIKSFWISSSWWVSMNMCANWAFIISPNQGLIGVSQSSQLIYSLP